VDWFNLSALWYLQTLVITFALAPLTFWTFRHLTDRGASLARPISLLLAIWPAWYLAGIGSGLVPFGPVTVWITIVALGAAAWLLALRSTLIDRESLQHLVIAEVGFLACFALFIWFHGYGPSITTGLSDTEKGMDLMMLASSMRADSMPPPDAWLADHDINYYYLGYLILGTIGRMVGATPAEAFTLSLATVVGMTIVATAGVAGNVIGRWYSLSWARLGGIVAVGFVAIAGNPWAAFTWLQNPSEQWEMGFFGDAIAWNSTRLLPSGNDAVPAITEFPAFSFILSDLHPHVMALPYAVVALGTAWMLATLPRERPSWPRLVLAGGVFGALYALNSWDFPSYLLIGLLALGWGTAGWAMRERLIAVATVIASSLFLWLPFFLRFEAPARENNSALADTFGGLPVIGGVISSIAAYGGPRTSFGDFLSVFGFVWIVALVLIGVAIYDRRDATYDPAIQSTLLVAGAIVVFGGILLPAPALIAAGVPVVAILLLFERDRALTLQNVALGLYGVAFALALAPEFFLLLDVFGTRMNTVFKLYYQVWLIGGIAAALAVTDLFLRLRSMPVLRATVAIGAAAMLALGSIFPVVAGNQWLNWRSPEREWEGIDGLAWMEEEAPGERAAIDWLLEHGSADEVILAAGGCDWYNTLIRVSAGSGVPQILGWHGHERQWHLGDAAYDGREGAFVRHSEAIQALFSTLDPALLDEYGVTYLYIGPAEQQGVVSGGGLVETSSTCAPGPFPNAEDLNWPGPGWTEVVNEEGIRLYRRDGA
jgi:YYY domain-containing protein